VKPGNQVIYVIKNASGAPGVCNLHAKKSEENEYMHNLVTEISVQNSTYNSIIKTNSLSKEKANHAWQ
jgi:hypothetical protein